MVQQRTATTASRYAWVILIVVFLAGMSAPLNQFKVPPVMPLLIEEFNLDLTSAGMLMSVFAITGFILALPAGFIMQRYGAKRAGLAAMTFVALGAVAGALSGTAAALLASRFIEGVGLGLIAVVGPAAVAMWFPTEIRGKAMGLWANWVPAGGLLMYGIAPSLATAFGWRSVWWVGAAFALVAFILYSVFFRTPAPGESGTEDVHSEAAPAPSLSRAMANRSIWLLSLEFMFFNVAGLGMSTFYPTFLNTVRGYTLAAAAITASLVTLTSLFAAPAGGWLSDRIGSRKLTIVIPILLWAIVLQFPYNVGGWMIPVSMVLMGLISASVPTSSFAAVPEIMERAQLAGIGMAVLALGQNLGMFIGPLVFGKLVESLGWSSAALVLIPICLLSAAAGWLVKVR